MLLLKFLYSPHHHKTLAEALVGSLFGNLSEKFPCEFGNPLMKASSMLIRRQKLKEWKFQRTIDIQPTGGLNYCSIESIRKYVEEIPKYRIGMIPSSTTIKATTKELEQHATFDFGLEIMEETTIHGHVFKFSIDVML
jgi:hypothetical protein